MPPIGLLMGNKSFEQLFIPLERGVLTSEGSKYTTLAMAEARTFPFI
ncbi:hypothetical protein [Paenibacillus urinalis]|uniref:Uncharacterized protein n=1 Tax=Paenibacillus urinalis TaxID=521520 RepID=A0AAX3N148_9BACL|nr:hypothetical protein [Paenibacillus urinalis]WDH83086.1 hypothetical protein PUW23_02245 [Paenibacillus urinalis]